MLDWVETGCAAALWIVRRYSLKQIRYALALSTMEYPALPDYIGDAKRDVRDRRLFSMWTTILNNDSSWTVSPGGSGMLTYLRLRGTCTSIERGVLECWKNIYSMWSRVPALQSSLHRSFKASQNDRKKCTGHCARMNGHERLLCVMSKAKHQKEWGNLQVTDDGTDRAETVSCVDFDDID